MIVGNARHVMNLQNIKDTIIALNIETNLSDRIYNLPGLTSPRSQTFLNRIAKDKNVLEIGSFCGASTVAMAESAKKVSTFDNWQNQETVAVLEKYQNIIINPKEEFLKNTKDYSNIDLYSYDIFKPDGFRKIYKLFEEDPFEVIFYDASHTQQDVITFLMLYQDIFKNCILVIDDYNFPEVQQAITFCTLENPNPPIKEFLIRTTGESKETFWNGIAIQIFK